MKYTKKSRLHTKQYAEECEGYRQNHGVKPAKTYIIKKL